MNFKMFMYYCALCGGWAALITWAVQQAAGLQGSNSFSPFVKTMIIAAILGVLLAFVIGLLDALLNSVGFARIVRVGICLAVGFVGSLIFGAIGEGIRMGTEGFTPDREGIRCFGWALVGGIIGASIGVWDILRASAARKGLKQAIRKMVNGIIGGVIGGFIGGALNDLVVRIPLYGMFNDPYGAPADTVKQWI